MPEPLSKLSLRAHRRGAELVLDVDARGWPAIVTVALLAAVAAALRWHQ